jgi:Flp pilus assembly protein TadG
VSVAISRRPVHLRAFTGQSLVEFALVLPLITLLLLGAVDLTRAFYSYIALQNATREAARVLIDFPNQYDDSAACAAGNQEGLPYVTVSCAAGTLQITPKANTSLTPPARQGGRHTVTVTATTTFTPVTILMQQLMGGSITLRASTTVVTWY